MTLMSRIVFLVLWMVGSSALAGTSSLFIDGNSQYLNAFVAGEVAHTEYRTETVAETCYEQRLDGYYTVCHYIGGDTQCAYDPRHGRHCWTTPGREICRQEPRYVTVPYTCYRQVTVPYTVHDYNVENEVEIHVGSAPADIGPLSETLLLTQVGETFGVVANQTSKKVFIYASHTRNEIGFSGGTKKFKTTVHLKFLDRTQLLYPLTIGMSDLSVTADALYFTLGKVTDPNTLLLSADIRKEKFWSEDEKYVLRALTPEEYTLTDLPGGLTQVRVDFAKLGILNQIQGKKIKYQMTTTLVVPQGQLLNSFDVPPLTQVKVLKQ